MTKISKKAAYPVKIPVRKDYFVGTDSENNGKTVNFDFESTAKLINGLNGTPILNYLFRTDLNIPLTVLTEGVFLSEGNQTTLSSITKLYINKKNFNEDNMSDLFRFISINREVFVMKLRNSSNLANGVYFKITGATEFADHFVLNVAIDISNVAFTQLINFNVYFFDFELKSASSIGTVDIYGKVDKVLGKQLSDENYTLAEKNKLASITEIFTTALKTAYDSSVSWIVTNGGNLIAHLSRTDNPHNTTKSQVGLSNIDNTSDLSKPVSTDTQNALDLKANLASPSLTGTPTAPTAIAGTNTTQLATTAFVAAATKWDQIGNDIQNNNTGSVSIGGDTFDGAKLKIKSLGSTSATYALSIVNSLGNNLLSLRDSGQLDLRSELISAFGGTFANVGASQLNGGFFGSGANALINRSSWFDSSTQIRYAVDLSAAYTDRSLVDKGYVDKNKLTSYTVSTLPAGTQGDTAFVTNALSPTYLSIITGGGTVVTPVFFNGTNWVAY